MILHCASQLRALYYLLWNKYRKYGESWMMMGSVGFSPENRLDCWHLVLEKLHWLRWRKDFFYKIKKLKCSFLSVLCVLLCWWNSHMIEILSLSLFLLKFSLYIKHNNITYVTHSIVMRNVPQCTFPRNRLLKWLHREKSHKIRFWSFGIFG